MFWYLKTHISATGNSDWNSIMLDISEASLRWSIQYPIHFERRAGTKFQSGFLLLQLVCEIKTAKKGHATAPSVFGSNFRHHSPTPATVTYNGRYYLAASTYRYEHISTAEIGMFLILVAQLMELSLKFLVHHSWQKATLKSSGNAIQRMTRVHLTMGRAGGIWRVLDRLLPLTEASGLGKRERVRA